MPQALLFHKDVFIPEFAKKPLHEGEVRYARHALHVSGGTEAIQAIELPREFDAKKATLIEAEVNPLTGDVEKQVWRQPLDEQWDLCFPMMPGGFIKTVWLNARTDTHATLNRTKFVGGYEWRKMKNKLPCAGRLQ